MSASSNGFPVSRNVFFTSNPETLPVKVTDCASCAATAIGARTTAPASPTFPPSGVTASESGYG